MVITDLLASLDNVYSREQLLDKIESLPDRIQPPSSIWEELDRIIREEKTLILAEQEKTRAAEEANEAALAAVTDAKKQKKEKSKRPVKSAAGNSVFGKIQYKKASGILILIAIIAAVYYFLLYDRINWELIGSTSTVFINSQPSESGSTISDGNMITANANTNYSIACGIIGRVEASEAAAVKCINDTSLSFITGSFRIFKNNKAKLFSAEVPMAVIKDAVTGGYYELIINAGTGTLLKNIGGAVTVESKNNKFYLPPGYECYIDEKKGAHIPYRASATEQFKSILTDTTLVEDTRADRILTMAAPADMISLWNMIKLVTPMKRGELFDYFSQHVQLPASINKDGIVYMNESMMTELRKLLEQLV